MIEIRSENIAASINAEGGFLTVDHVRLPDGRMIQPMFANSWADEPGNNELPLILRYMSSEWPCVPHGAPAPPPNLPARWPKISFNTSFNEMHGFCANNSWTLSETGVNYIEMFIDYPLDHPIARVERRIEMNNLKITFSLSVTSRQDTRISIGVHPIFNLSKQALKTSIQTSFKKGFVFPVDFIPGISRLLPDTDFTELAAVPLKDGSVADMSKMPFAWKTDEVVLLSEISGEVTLVNEESHYSSVLRWDTGAFPSCLLWFANGGRQEKPYNGVFYGLGIEPVANAFGMGTDLSANPENPITKQGIPTSIYLNKDRKWETTYSIEFKN